MLYLEPFMFQFFFFPLLNSIILMCLNPEILFLLSKKRRKKAFKANIVKQICKSSVLILPYYFLLIKSSDILFLLLTSNIKNFQKYFFYSSLESKYIENKIHDVSKRSFLKKYWSIKYNVCFVLFEYILIIDIRQNELFNKWRLLSIWEKKNIYI